MRHPRIVVAALLLAALGVATPSFARGGTGGGGGGGGTGGGGGGGGGTTTVKWGAIDRVSGTATCDGTSVFPVQLKKGFDNRIELQMTPSGPELGDGRWTVRTHAVELDKPLGGMGTTISANSIITSLQGGVPAGTHTIRFTAVRSTPNDLLTDPAATVLESCALDLVVVAK